MTSTLRFAVVWCCASSPTPSSQMPSRRSTPRLWLSSRCVRTCIQHLEFSLLTPWILPFDTLANPPPTACSLDRLYQMENITNFLDFARAQGVRSDDLFQTVALYEAENMSQVLQTLSNLKRISAWGWNSCLLLRSPHLSPIVVCLARWCFFSVAAGLPPPFVIQVDVLHCWFKNNCTMQDKKLQQRNRSWRRACFSFVFFHFFLFFSTVPWPPACYLLSHIFLLPFLFFFCHSNCASRSSVATNAGIQQKKY